MKTVIFDMDGVIFDTERLVLNVWKKVAPKYGFDNIDKVFYKIVGTNTEYTERVFREEYGKDIPYSEFRAEARGVFSENVEKNGMPVKKGAREILEYLKGAAFKVGLASSTNSENVLRELKMAGLHDFFDVIAGGDKVKKSKPEPDIYLYACRALGVSPTDAYAIEDSYNGVRSASAAGLKTIMIPDMREPDDEMYEKAAAVFTDLFQAQDYFKNAAKPTIVAATGNKGKLREIRKIFPDFNIISQREAGIDFEPEENGKSFEENALIKARAVHSVIGGYTLADDSGLCVDALRGAPGIYSARYAGVNASDKDRIAKLLTELNGKDNRSAHFETCVALILPDGTEITAHGIVNGHILNEPQGENGFGYDPVFWCDELNKTFAQADEDEKNAVSHRGRALQNLLTICNQTFSALRKD